MSEEELSEIDKLANFIMKEVDGEPSQSQGAGQTAIRIIRKLKTENTSLKEENEAMGVQSRTI